MKYMKEFNGKSISENKEIELIQKAKQGNEKALTMLIELNQGYIISFIRQKYSGLIKNDEFLFDDLVQEGNIGIITAVHKFDETKEVKFITYASHWIKSSIIDAVKRYGNPYDETFDENDIKLNENEDTFDESDIQLNENTSFEDYDSSANENILIENEAFTDDTKDDSIIESQSDEIDNLLLSILDERETEILKMYFGINISPKSLNEIGDIFSLSSERVRQLKERALKRVKKRDKSFFEKYISRRNEIDRAL